MILDMEYTPCPLCGSENSEAFRKAKDRLEVVEQEFVLEHCLDCNLVYQNPRVPIDNISFFYPDNYFSSRPGRNTRQKARSERIVKLKCEMVDRLFDRPGRLLEVGSANGEFLVGMRDRNWKVQGVEVSIDAANFSREKFDLKIFNGELTKRPDEGERFDAIVLWGVFPHIHNPVEVISIAAELLETHGKLIICCANIDSLASSYMKNRWGHLDLPRHYCMWSADTLRELFRKTNLNLSQVIYHDDIFSSQLVLRGLYPFVKGIKDGRSGITMKKIVRLIAAKINLVVTSPVSAMARKQKRGGILTAIGKRIV